MGYCSSAISEFLYIDDAPKNLPVGWSWVEFEHGGGGNLICQCHKLYDFEQFEQLRDAILKTDNKFWPVTIAINHEDDHHFSAILLYKDRVECRYSFWPAMEVTPMDANPTFPM